MAPITDALGLAEDGVLAALAALAPIGAAWWDPGEPDLNRRLALPATDAKALSRYYLAHHQDGGGRRADRVHSSGWEGLITVRVRSRDRSAARAGLALVAAAMAALVSPAGYALHATWEKPLSIPQVDLVTTSAGIWRVTIRRVPAS